MIKQIDDKGHAICHCDICGQDFDFGKLPDEDDMFAGLMRQKADAATCPQCEARALALNEARKIKAQKERLATTLHDRVLAAGIAPRFADMEKPWVRHTAEWLWHHRNGSLLLAGPTGTGKTSGAAFVLRLMMQDRYMAVRYHTRQSLVAAYVKAKCDEEGREQAFYDRLAKLDVLVVDEMVGKKGNGRLSDSSQELLFNLIDGVYSQARKTRVWILGNFYAGAIDDLVDDPAPLKRRLADSFALGWADECKVEQIAL